jgi:hypothetical protein
MDLVTLRTRRPRRLAGAARRPARRDNRGRRRPEPAAVAAGFRADLRQPPHDRRRTTGPRPGTGANQNRLGGFFSDLFYDRNANVYYGLPDRGPGGGVISYETRVQKFSLDVDPVSGRSAGSRCSTRSGSGTPTAFRPSTGSTRPS